MTDIPEELVRLRKLERVVAFALYTFPLIFAVQTLIIVLAMPVFKAMFADFGARLPEATHYAIEFRFIWLGLSILVATIPVVFLRKKGLTHGIVVTYGAVGLVQFVLAQALTLAMFLPIFELGSVADSL